MRSAFRGYYSPSDSEIDEIWSNGHVILDANAILNLFRYTESTRIDFLKVLELRRENLWIPHQVGLEFHRNRLDVISQQDRAFSALAKVVEAAESGVKSVLDQYRKHPSLDAEKFTHILNDALTPVKSFLDKSRNDHVAFLEGPVIDEVGSRIAQLFDQRVGSPYSDTELESIYREGEKRYEKKLPPGYKDSTKPAPEKYGDLVLWRQIMDHARSERRPALFVTDDTKDDWWHRVSNQTQGPRPELVEEYFIAAESRIHFYRPERFLQFAKERESSLEIHDESVSEVEEISGARANRALAVLEERRVALEEELEYREARVQSQIVKFQQRLEHLRANERSIAFEVSDLKRAPVDFHSSDPSDYVGRIATLQKRWQSIKDEIAEIEHRLERANSSENRLLERRRAEILSEHSRITEAIEEIENGGP